MILFRPCSSLRGAQRRGNPSARTALAALLALTLLTACGKKGSPVPPGPANEIVYPRAYPSR